MKTIVEVFTDEFEEGRQTDFISVIAKEDPVLERMIQQIDNLYKQDVCTAAEKGANNV